MQYEMLWTKEMTDMIEVPENWMGSADQQMNWCEAQFSIVIIYWNMNEGKISDSLSDSL